MAHTSGVARERHVFVDNVRFWSMAAIVAIHCTGAVLGTLHRGTPLLEGAITIPLKFGTIAFFLISGFLMGERLEGSKRSEYVRKRFRKILTPWLFWFSLQIVYCAAVAVWVHGVRLRFDPKTVHKLLGFTESSLMATSFWFVPNLLLALCILLIFRKYIRDPRFGAVLLIFNLFYAMNIYTLWVPSNHTVALLGFIFYLWLGAFASQNRERLNAMLSRVSAGAMFALTLLTCALCFAEAFLLYRLHAPDPTNTLRLSNQLFSVVVVLFIMKLRYRLWPRFVDVGSDMFSVYLAQTIGISLLASATKRMLPRLHGLDSLTGPLAFLIFWSGITSAVLLGCIALSKVCGRTKALRWIVGKTLPTQPSPVSAFAAARERQVRTLEPATVELELA